MVMAVHPLFAGTLPGTAVVPGLLFAFPSLVRHATGIGCFTAEEGRIAHRMLLGTEQWKNMHNMRKACALTTTGKQIQVIHKHISIPAL
jgi:hypothetical protein